MFQSLFKRNKTPGSDLASKVVALKALNLEKGQVLVVQIHESIDQVRLLEFQSALQTMIPNNPVLVCDEKFEFFKVTNDEFNMMRVSKPGQA